MKNYNALFPPQHSCVIKRPSPIVALSNLSICWYGKAPMSVLIAVKQAAKLFSLHVLQRGTASASNSVRAHRREAKIDTDCTRKVKCNRTTLSTATTRDKLCDLQDLFAQNMNKQSKKDIRIIRWMFFFNVFIPFAIRK